MLLGEVSGLRKRDYMRAVFDFTVLTVHMVRRDTFTGLRLENSGSLLYYLYNDTASLRHCSLPYGIKRLVATGRPAMSMLKSTIVNTSVSKAVTSILLVIVLSGSASAGNTTLIPGNANWKYLVRNSYPDSPWMTTSFDDSLWPSVPGPLGYGESFLNTLIGYGGNSTDKYITTMFRHTFSVSLDSIALDALRLETSFDDGFVACLNGVEIARRSLPTGSVNYATTASSREAGAYESIDITSHADKLLDGANLLAVEVHQRSATSSDLVWDASLTAGSNSQRVQFMWSGAVTPVSIRVKARLTAESAVARLAVSEQPDFVTVVYSVYDTAITAQNERVVDFVLNGLIPNRRYYYAVEVNGTLDTVLIGRFRTFPADTGSFAFAFGSCNWTGSSHPVFDTIRLREPLFFFHLGDIHYQNISVNDRELFRDALRRDLTSASQSRLYSSVPIAYIWDDHDYGPNNSDSTAPGRLAARLTYQEYVPHYPLVEGTGDVAIYQAFTVGRVRFVVCDSRSARSPASAPDNQFKTMLGTTQKTWFKQQLLDARDKYPLIIWVNSLPWIGFTGDDGWYEYTYERRELANFIADNHITNLCMISGDAHMVAIDDGSNSDYSDSGGAAFPVFHAASLDRTPGVKGGPYSHGAYPGVGQFGLFSVQDGPDSIRVDWSGRHYLNGELVHYSFTYPVDILTSTDGTGENKSRLPAGLVLSQNYPNPFNAGTVIEYTLPETQHVNLTIFNVLGQPLVTLVSQRQSAGTHRVFWDGLDLSGHPLASGVYLYQIVAGQARISHRMVLLK